MTPLAVVGTTQFLILGLIAIIPLIAIVDILRNEFTGYNKIVWLIAVVFVPAVGVILYFLIGVKQKLQKD